MRKVTNVKRNLVPAVCKAVRGLHETRGSSLQAIATFIQATVKPGAAAPTIRDVKAALRAAEAKQKVVVANGRFLLPRSFACPKKKVSRRKRACGMKRKKSKCPKRKASRSSRRSHKKRKSLCKPRCQKKKRCVRKKRKCSRPCTRMWKPKKSKKCNTEYNVNQDAANIESNQDAADIISNQIKAENPQ